MKRWHWIVVIPALLIVALVVGLFGYRGVQQHRIATLAEGLRAKGWALSADELRAAWPAPAKEENGAPLYQWAYEEMVRVEKSLRGKAHVQLPYYPDDIPFIGRELEEHDLPESRRVPVRPDAIARYLETHDEVSAAIDRAVQCSATQFGADYGQGLFAATPQHMWMLYAMKLQRLRAHYALMQKQPAVAYVHGANGRRLADSLARAPLYLALPVRAAMHHEAMKALEWCLNTEAPTAEQLDDLAAAWVDVDGADTLRNYWMTEAAAWWELSADRLVNELNKPGVDRVIRSERDVPEELSQVPWLENVMANAGKPGTWSYWWDEPADRLAFLEKVERLDVICESPVHTMLGKASTIAAVAADAPPNLFRARFSLGNPQDIIKAMVRIEAYTRLAQTAIAIERYRLASERPDALPETLADLVPAYLAELPVDPYCGEPLFYDRLPEGGYLVYTASVEEGTGKRNLEIILRVLRWSAVTS